jgi:hypothetical protein
MASGRIILVDTMVILRCHEHRCWTTLAKRFPLETVEKCIEETQTGQRTRQRQAIDEQALRADFKAIHAVTQLQIAQVQLTGGENLDDGEQQLWAHALSRDDAWVLTGPDTASMKFGFRAGFRERLVSVGGLFGEIGFKPQSPLPDHFQKRWLEDLMARLTLGEL